MTVIANRQSEAAVEQREDLITLTIDDIDVSVPKGTLGDSCRRAHRRRDTAVL